METRPLYDLRLQTPRLQLRLGSREELVALGHVAEAGIHPPEEMPFAVAWSDRIGQAGFLDEFVAFHERHRADWSPEAWSLHLLVWEDGKLVGTQNVHAKEFSKRRAVGTGSWIGRTYQRQGIGTEMRAAVLELAFRGLGAIEAESSWLDGNEASRRISMKLGYAESSVGEKSPRGVPVREFGVAIEHGVWSCPVPMTIEGLEPCLPLFGVSDAPGKGRASA